LFGALAIDAAFNVEQGVDALDRFERDGRDRRRRKAATSVITLSSVATCK
jgi:hypothetical protein